LIELARLCGYSTADNIHIVEKAILLLERKADILCRDCNGDTVLHTVLKCSRLHEEELEFKSKLKERGELWRWRASLLAPKDLLIVFITAGADVYATNDEGETPSMVASGFEQEEEWIEALTACGFDVNEVLEQSSPDLHDCTRVRQTSKLSFEEYCQQRPEYWQKYSENWQKYWQDRIEQVESDEEDEDEGDTDEEEGGTDEDEDSDSGSDFNEDNHSKIYDEETGACFQDMGNIEVNSIGMTDVNMNDFFDEDDLFEGHDEGGDVAPEDMSYNKGKDIDSMDFNMDGFFDDIMDSTDESWTNFLNWEDM
jgi:hypothetical protein